MSILTDAIHSNNLDTVLEVLNSETYKNNNSLINSDIDEKTDFNPIQLAVSLGRKNMILPLKNHGAVLNVITSDGVDLIGLAIKIYGCEDRRLMVKYLLELLIEIDGNPAPLSRGNTHLHLAARLGNELAVRYLIKRLSDDGCDIDVANDDGDNPLHVAGKNGHFKIVHFLLHSMGCYKGTEYEDREDRELIPEDEALDLALKDNNVPVVQFLIAEANSKTLPLSKAVRSNNVGIVKDLVRYQLDPYTYDYAYDEVEDMTITSIAASEGDMHEITLTFRIHRLQTYSV